MAEHGYCECGCGRKTAIAKRGDSRRGHVKGEPQPLLPGHKRITGQPDYEVRGAGYETSCWIWLKGKDGKGYGEYHERRPGPERSYDLRMPHRVNWERANGRKLEPREHAHHMCGNRDCVNPDHIEIVSSKEHHQRHLIDRLTRPPKRKNSASGIPGVARTSKGLAWQGRVQYLGQRHHLGVFATKDEAAEAVLAKRRELASALADHPREDD